MSALLRCIMRSLKKRTCVLIFNMEKNLIDLSKHILIVWKQNRKKMLLFLTSFFPLIFTYSVSKRTPFFLPVCQRKLITQAALLSETLL